MQAAAHNSKFAKEAGIPQEVAKEFNEADKMKAKNKKQSIHEKMYGISKTKK